MTHNSLNCIPFPKKIFEKTENIITSKDSNVLLAAKMSNLNSGGAIALRTI